MEVEGAKGGFVRGFYGRGAGVSLLRSAASTVELFERIKILL